MDLGQIYQKTEKGYEEIRSRRFKLPKRPRTLLILVDGRTPLDLVLGQARALGIEDSTVFELIGQGFIAPLGAGAVEAGLADSDPEERFRSTQRFMNESVVNALGLRALFFTLKLERCASLSDLRELMPAYQQALAKAGDPVQAEVLTARLQLLLARGAEP
ncbi:MAG: hypothetical protein KGI67_10210 [Pseudomonadota bacterium]|nr:hypothetical protein [Pseudomonadota bacterium]